MSGTQRTTGFRESDLYGSALLLFLLACCVAYYAAFAVDMKFYDEDSGLFQLALNAHDHFVYLANVERIRAGEFAYYELRNDLGIAAVYLALSDIAPAFLIDEYFSALSLAVNLASLILCYAIYASICNHLHLGKTGKIAFFANLSLIYFAQLINKDMLTVLVFLLAVWCGLNKRLYWLLIITPAALVIRQQLAVFALMFFLLMTVKRPIRWMVFLYLLTAVVAGLLSVFASLFGAESLEDGFTAWLVEFNSNYYVGYIIFNPLRVLQYVVDAYLSFSFWTDKGGIDTAKLLRLPQLILLAVLWRPISTLILRFRSVLTDSTTKPLTTAVVTYLLVWLMNPTVNARYVMLITPILVLFALRVQRSPRVLHP